MNKRICATQIAASLTTPAVFAAQPVCLGASFGSSFSVNDTAAMLSICTAYRFAPQLAATLDLVNYGSSNKDNTNLHSRSTELGLQYNF